MFSENITLHFLCNGYHCLLVIVIKINNELHIEEAIIYYIQNNPFFNTKLRDRVIRPKPDDRINKNLRSGVLFSEKI